MPNKKAACRRQKKKNTSRKTPVKGRFSLHFRNPLLYEAALSHPSYRNENPSQHSRLEDFDRLEFFGDAILNFIICKKIYPLFPEADEGMLSRLRSILVSRKILFRITRQTGLFRAVRLGKSLQNQEDFLKVKLAADVLEAMIGALYLDQGLEKTEKFILKHFTPYFDSKKLFRLDPNPKSTLQELVQKYWQKLPVYISQTNEEGVRTTVSVTKGRRASSQARTRKESEEKAARLLLRILRQEFLRRAKKKSSAGKF